MHQAGSSTKTVRGCAMDNGVAASVLLLFGLLATILTTLGLADEIFRTDILATQKVFGAWVSLIAISNVSLITGLKLLVS